LNGLCFEKDNSSKKDINLSSNSFVEVSNLIIFSPSNLYSTRFVNLVNIGQIK